MEQNNTITAEGTVTESKKDPWYMRLIRHPVTKKVMKIAGIAGSILGAGFGGYEIGLRSGRHLTTLEVAEEPEKIEEKTEE